MGSLLVLAPHPDDEILGAGAIMARTVQNGDRVSVVVLTDGTRSDPDVPAEQLRQRRRDECREGLKTIVGAEIPLLFLEQPDGFLAQSDIGISGDTPLANFLSAAAPDTIIVTDPSDSHPDHKAAFGFATRLMSAGHGSQLKVMPVGQRVDGVFNPEGFEEFPVGPLSSRKCAAIACHRSQTLGGGGFMLSPEITADFVQTEFLKTVYDRNDCLSDAVPSDHFDAIFTDSPDPWRYHTEPYERDRFQRTVTAIAGRRYRSALELGCANGALTEHLAPLCNWLLATDASEVALNLARARLAAHTNVAWQQANLPEQTPAGRFDLIVASDMLYYLGLKGVSALMGKLEKSASRDCRILIASYLGQTNTRLTGEMSAETAIAHLPNWTVSYIERTDQLRIDVLERR